MRPAVGVALAATGRLPAVGEKTNMAQAKNNTKLGPTNSIKGGGGSSRLGA